jgi:cytochrome b561
MTIVSRLRLWAEHYTENGHFSPVGIVFHWVMAALILFQLALGWAMTLMMPVGGEKLHWFEVHSAIGLLIFVLAFMRAAWRMLVQDPYNDADTQGWRTKFAYATESIFYVCFLLLPLTGWAMWSSIAPPGPLSVGGFLPWPQLPLEDVPMAMRWQIMGMAESLHLILVWVLLLLIPLHVAAALKHHFWDRHDVLQGMLPEVPDWKGPEVEPKRKPKAARPPRESEAG